MNNRILGIDKKSFSLFYNGGSIWCEHLDSLYHEHELLKAKFNQDLAEIKKPSESAFIAVALAQTEVTKEILDFLFKGFFSLGRPLKKIVLIGLNFSMKRYAKKTWKDTGFLVNCIDDFEHAKMWLLP